MAKAKSIKHYKDIKTILNKENTAFHMPSREITLMKQIELHKADGYYRKGTFTNEVVWNKKAFKFPRVTRNNPFRKKLYLFNMVRIDAMAYLDKIGGTVKLPKQYPVNEINMDYKHVNENITATDINSTYWKIAYNLGVISQKTYEHGLGDDYKVLRLACLSTLGAAKEYQLIKDGIVQNETIKVGGNVELANVYRMIRFTCFSYMQTAKKKLGDDFVGYKTDCIYYRDTRENRAKIRAYFKSVQLEYKQLVDVSAVREKKVLKDANFNE